MPKIAELREIDGAIWARLDIDRDSPDQPVHLLVNSEVERIKSDIIKMCAEIAESYSNAKPGDICEVQAGDWQYEIANAIRSAGQAPRS